MTHRGAQFCSLSHHCNMCCSSPWSLIPWTKVNIKHFSLIRALTVDFRISSHYTWKSASKVIIISTSLYSLQVLFQLIFHFKCQHDGLRMSQYFPFSMFYLDEWKLCLLLAQMVPCEKVANKCRFGSCRQFMSNNPSWTLLRYFRWIQTGRETKTKWQQSQKSHLYNGKIQDSVCIHLLVFYCFCVKLFCWFWRQMKRWRVFSVKCQNHFCAWFDFSQRQAENVLMLVLTLFLVNLVVLAHD